MARRPRSRRPSPRSCSIAALVFITAWPTGGTRPLAATVNPRPGVPVPNQAYLKLGAGGELDLYNLTGRTDIVIDVFGYVI